MSVEKISYRRIDSATLAAGGLGLYHPEMGVWDVMATLPAGLP